MLRPETKVRARTLQLLYAWEIQGSPDVPGVAAGLLQGDSRWVRAVEQAEERVEAVVAAIPRLDPEIEKAADNWRLDRIGIIERNILRLSLHELEEGSVPPRVTINEGIRLARWFAGAKAPAFVNGVLDAMARRLGRL